MKASELISKLTELIALHGDLPVTAMSSWTPSEEEYIAGVEWRTHDYVYGSETSDPPRFYIDA